MIDIRILRDSPERIRENLEKRNITNFPFEELLDLDKKRRELIAKNQKLKEEKNKISLEVSKAKSSGKDAQEIISKMRLTSEEITENDKQIESTNTKLNGALGNSSELR